eukprot:TRINITY_DN2924_c0_g1_i3.p1 TRINITY_DN2924_c0_g1~~TRINITY_DN2924_c0_g1_i3.p1  ORF type:complete len:790 (+),score=185.08 TRINITY_DN2924_c0_g1_i3:27-2372(+)
MNTPRDAFRQSAEGLIGIMVGEQMRTGLPHDFTFDPVHKRLYFLAVPKGTRTTSLQYIQLDQPSGQAGEWHTVFSAQARTMTKEEELLRERMRSNDVGVTSYTPHLESSQFAVPLGANLVCVDLKQPDPQVRIVDQDFGGVDVTWSADAALLAYCKGGDIWVHHPGTGLKQQVTHSALRGKHVTSGEASFILQEEFDNYRGYWWSPVATVDQQRRTYRIAYMEDTTEHVHRFSIPTPGYTGEADLYRYPLAGTPNSLSTLRMAEIVCNEGAPGPLQVSILDLQTPLAQAFPWVEYVVRCGWHDNGTRVWMQLVDRQQLRIALVSVPVSAFQGASSSSPAPAGPEHIFTTLHEEASPVWINVTDIIHFFEDGSNRILWASEQSGFRHLYILTPSDKGPQVVPVTASPEDPAQGWMVDRTEVWVDEARQLIYFSGTRDTVLERHLYAVSYAAGSDQANVVRLTSPGMTHEVSMDKDRTMFVDKSSSLSSPYQYTVHRIVHGPLLSVDAVSSLPIRPCKVSSPMPLVPPSLFTFRNTAGHIIHGAYYLPANYDPAKTYPAVVRVYGGPHVQIVTNSFDLTASLDMQMYTGLGYICVLIDNVGSDRRGLVFESQLKHAMGSVELKDQVQGIGFLKSIGIAIDTARVGIMGWSYGGYLSLMALGQHPDRFKVAIPKCPVSLWEAYDTGYTERYMDTPANNKVGYARGSVLTYAPQFPNEEGRLLLVHGLQDENVHFSHTSVMIEALIANNKPYNLLVLPRERHGCANVNTRKYLELRCALFLYDNL